MTSDRHQLAELLEQEKLPEDKLTEALSLLTISPTKQKWQSFLMTLLLWIGGFAIAFAGLFFIAFNWDELGRFSKFTMVETSIILSMVIYWKLGSDKASAKVALFVAIILLGVLLALFGQTYQTGADPWQLFFYWALLILPWALIGRFATIWIFWLSLLNLSIILYYQAHGHIIWILFGYRSQILWPLFIFNSTALFCWEALSNNRHYLQQLWATRLIATVSGVVITWIIIQSIFGDPSLNLVPYLVWAIWLGAMYWKYRKVKVELFMLAGLCLSTTVIIVMGLGKVMLSDANPMSFLFLALLIIGLGTSSAFWLRNIHREILEQESNS